MVIKMINQLVSKIKKTSAPIVVGLDPMMKFVPEQVKTKAFDEFGETLEGQRKLSGSLTRRLLTIFMMWFRQ